MWTKPTAKSWRRLLSPILLILMVALATACVGDGLDSNVGLQGQLTGADGELVADGDYEMTIRFWTAETGGSNVFTQTQTVAVADGLFDLNMTNFPPHVFSGELTSQPYLEIEIEGETLAPRRAISGSAYAHGLVPGTGAIGPRPDRDNVTDDGYPAVFTAINTQLPTNDPGFGIVAQSANAGLYVDNLRGDGNLEPAESPEHNPDIILGGRYLSAPDGETDTDNNHAGVIATEPDESFSGMFLRSNYRLELFKSYSNENWSLPDFRVYHGQRDADHLQLRLDNDGNLSIEGNYSSGGADYAERIEVEDPGITYGIGDVLVISTEQDRAVTLADEANSTRVIGVYSANPGFVAGADLPGEQVRQERAALQAVGIDPDDPAAVEAAFGSAELTEIEINDGKINVAIAGIVPVKVSAENGAIERGDLLTTASIPGHAMKATNPQIGSILGKAMGTLDEGTGMIEVLVMLQ
jgi:hypothetical protein